LIDQRVVPGSDGETRSWLPNTLEWMDANYERVFSADPTLNRLPPLPAEGYVEMVHYDQHDGREMPPIEVFLLDESVEHHRIPMLMSRLHEGLREAPFQVDDLIVFPLTVSDHAHGDGRCVGVGVAPASRSEGIEGEQAGVPGERAQWKERLEKAAEDAGRGRRMRVGTPHAAHSIAWARPARRWRSTTPARFFPDVRIAEFELRRLIRERFGAEVEWFIARPDAMERWESTWAAHGLVDGLGQWWVEFETDIEIDGPVVLGAARELGFGVFAPRHADRLSIRRNGPRA